MIGKKRLSKLGKGLLTGVLVSAITGAGILGLIKSKKVNLEDRIKHQKIAKIETFRPENTNRYIIWIKQEHSLPGDNNYTGESERIQKTNDFQKGIYDILEHLRNSIGANVVYHESFTEKDKETGALARLSDNPRYPYINGGAIKLAREGKIELRPAETEEMNQKAFMESYKLVTGEEIKYVFDGRERIAIESIGKDNLKIAVLVYGAAHEFKDDIERWNRENPNRKYNLIEIVPEGLE